MNVGGGIPRFSANTIHMSESSAHPSPLPRPPTTTHKHTHTWCLHKLCTLTDGNLLSSDGSNRWCIYASLMSFGIFPSRATRVYVWRRKGTGANRK